ncbi:MAG: HAMP domain-containing protein [Methylophilaceae bacterium]|jgi:two-component system sensor histidine kinase UhpB|nr:HAMP domain-containing protein [Methylophilaceae bacterium]
MSLRLRLNLLITTISILFMVASGIVIVQDAKTSIQERVEAATRVTVQLLDTVIISSTMNPSLGLTSDVLSQFLRSLGYVRSNHIVLYDLYGRVLYESPKSTYRSEVHPPDWFVKMVQPKGEKVERRIRYGVLVIQSNAEGSIRDAWRGVRQFMWLGIGFFILLNVLVYVLLSVSLQPVKQILAAIRAIEGGDLTVRLGTFKLPEFDHIAHSLNRMAESLEAERQLEENRQLTQLIQSHIEDERRSLARELHDELGQYVTAIKTFAVGIVKKTEQAQPDISANAQTIVSAANHIYDGMHNIIRTLRPGSLDNLGLSETLRDVVNNWQNQYPELQFELNLSGDLNDLGETININIYRIVQESVNNALKHANANHLKISLTRKTGRELRLTIQDDGQGMNVTEVDQSQHFGLLGMRERVQALHGEFQVSSQPSRGTLISIVIPEDKL